MGAEQGQSMYPLSPSPPGHPGLACPLDKDHSFCQAVLQGLALLHPFRFRGGNGFMYLSVMKYPLFISLNAAHIFVNSHFLKLFSNYPISTCHLFLISPDWIIGHHGPGVQSRWVNSLLREKPFINAGSFLVLSCSWVMGSSVSFHWSQCIHQSSFLFVVSGTSCAIPSCQAITHNIPASPSSSVIFDSR